MIDIKFILASSSPRRIELLKNLNLNFLIKIPKVKEDFSKNLTPPEIAMINSYKKARAIGEMYKDDYVAGFDTIVVLNDEIIGKPKDRKDAYNILKKLSSKTHKVITGYTILNLEKNFELKRYCESYVTFKELDEIEINWYLNTEEPYDKAGAYAIQGKGAFMVKKIEGSFTNVIGLPLTEFLEDLKRLK